MPTRRKLFESYTRRGDGKLEKPFEKPVVVPHLEEKDPALHAWADARFATDIMAEHGLFFALLLPKETAPAEHNEALKFSRVFQDMHDRIDVAGPPDPTDVKRFTTQVTDKIKPFIEWKAKYGEAQRTGRLRSLVWPMFFDHTRHEAERWTRRLEQVGRATTEFDRDEVVTFWTNIMDEHALFVAHLLDPSEFALIDEAMRAHKVFSSLTGGIGGSVKATAKSPRTVLKALVSNPEMDEVLSAAELVLDFKTKAARDIEAARIKSIIDPRLADHVRREAQKFVDELRRADAA